MSLLFIDSFDHYAYADIAEKWTSVQRTDAAIGSTYARTGANGLYMKGGGLRLAVGTQTSFMCGAAIKPTVIQEGDGILFSIGSSVLPSWAFVGPPYSRFVQLIMTVSGLLEVYVANQESGFIGGTQGQSLGLTSVALQEGVWSYVELKCTTLGAASTITVRINNQEVFSKVGDTRVNGRDPLEAAADYAEWDFFDFGGASGVTDRWYVDDFYLGTLEGGIYNDFLGDCRIDAHFPTAPGTYSQWTRVGTDSGANWDQVNETAPNDDTDANEATVGGEIDTFASEDLVPEGNTILAVQHVVSRKKIDAGSGTVAPVFRIGGVDYVGTSQYPPADAYNYGLALYEQAPTGAAWDESTFDAAEIGYKRTT